MTAHEMLAKVRNLPPVSRAALELGSLIGKTDTTNEEIVRILRQDSVLTAKLLRACNSSAMALREPVASVDQAVFLLGHGEISRLATAIAFHGPLAMPLRAYALQTDDLWQHSVRAATAAEFAAANDTRFKVDVHVAYTLGLLHDIGKLVTNEFLDRQTMIAIRQEMVEGKTLVEAERKIMGTDHAEVGAALAYLWHLPEPIIESISLHHQPVLRPYPRLSALVCLANAVAHKAALPVAVRENGKVPDEYIFAALELSPAAIQEMVVAVSEPQSIGDEITAIQV